MTRDRKAPHPRVNRSFFGAMERRVLPWMANRLPAWIVPDHLTFAGLVAAGVIGIAYVFTRFSLNWLWLANAGLVLHWLGDSLDGTLARVRHIEREKYGFFVDHHGDTISVFLIGMGIGVSPLMDLRIAMLLIIGYYALMTLVYIVTLARGTFKISFAGFGPTEIRAAIIVVNTCAWAFKNPVFAVGPYRIGMFTAMGIVVLIVLLILYLTFGEIERRELAKLDPPRTAAQPEPANPVKRAAAA